MTQRGDASNEPPLAVHCARCGADLAAGARFCGHCGAEQTRRCRACGTLAHPEAAFCPSCGAALEAAAPTLAGPAAQAVLVERATPPPARKRLRLRWIGVGLLVAVLLAGGAVAAVLVLRGGGETTEARTAPLGPPPPPALADEVSPSLRALSASQATVTARVISLRAGVQSFAALRQASDALAAQVARTQRFLKGVTAHSSRDATKLTLLRRALAAHLAYAQAISDFPPRPRSFTNAQAQTAIARAEQAQLVYARLAGADPSLPRISITSSDHLRLLTVVPSPKPRPSERAEQPTRGVPSRYSGHFTSVDRLERCYANDDYAVCTAGPSRKGVRLVVGSRVSYEGITGSTDTGGPAMPMGTSFRTPRRTIECGSSSRGITCTDLTTGSYFVIGDYRVRVNNGSGEVVH